MTRRDVLRHATLLAGATLTGAATAPALLGATPAPAKTGTASASVPSSGSASGAGPASSSAPASGSGAAEAFLYCLNTATIRAHKLGIVREVELVAKAGYRGIEPWVASIAEYVKGGGSLAELRRRIDDAGLRVCGLIGFAEWAVDDDAKRAAGLEQAAKDMAWAAELGSPRIAAPPAGVKGPLDHAKAVDRYAVLLEVGAKAGVTPQLEFWGASKSLNQLGPAAAIALATGNPKACVLTDVYHMYRGGSDFGLLRQLGHAALPLVHINDYPAEPAREQQTDAHRVYPGDGVAPLTQILRDLRASGSGKVLSLELFNKTYYAQEPLLVARTGLEKMKAAVARAGV